MENRLVSLNKNLSQELALLVRELFLEMEGVMVSFSQVKVTPDLRSAYIFVSVLPLDQQHQVLKILRRERKELQAKLAPKLAWKFLPRLVFVLDKEVESKWEMDGVLDQVEANF